MTPEAAGEALAADPTFNLMSAEEREREAAALLGGFATPSDDPLDIALAVEIAEATAAVPPQAVTPQPGEEPCRLNGAEGPPCNGSEPIAGNGRCMTCGAMRRPPEGPQMPAREPPAVLATVAPKITVAPPGEARAAVALDPDAAFVARFKEATGAADSEIASMLGKSRATIQAYIGGRLPEKLTPAEARTLADDVQERMVLLADLKRDISAVIGEIE